MGCACMTAASADVHCTCLPVQADVKVQNMVTLGASVLNNNSAAYASYAILVDQAIGQQVTYSHRGLLYTVPANRGAKWCVIRQAACK